MMSVSSSTDSPDAASLFTVAEWLAMPVPPVLSSRTSGWDNIQLALFDQPAHHIPEHVSAMHTICINAGVPVRLEQTIDGQRLVGASVTGDVGLYPAGRSQTFQWETPAKFLQLYVEPAYLNQIGMALHNRDEVELLPQEIPADPMIGQIAIALQNILTHKQPGSKLYADSLATSLATHLVYHYAACVPAVKTYTGRLSNAQLKIVQRYIEEHLTEDISLAELAATVQLSPFHFSRLFKQSTGTSPHRYHIHCRVKMAKQLLKEKKLPIAQVAYQVGFSSQSHLNYHFKRFVGLTPTAYLRQ